MQDNPQINKDIFDRDGFLLVPEAVAASTIEQLTDALEAKRRTDARLAAPGLRHLLKRCKAVRNFAKSEPMLQLAQQALGSDAKPIKAILFDKTPAANWYVTWHQDLTIAVKERLEVAGFGPWSVKDGIPHVQPPEEVLRNVVSLRVHLDDCPQENGAIKFIAGSHNRGILDTEEATSLKAGGKQVCVAAAQGDVIVMRPLILHSSSQSTQPQHRRVLHIEYVGCELPGGLEWAESSGLDSVELVMGIEEEFGITIPDHDAEKLTTVGQTFEYLKLVLNSKPAGECLTQKVFYKVRRAFVENYRLNRNSMHPDTQMTDLLSYSDFEEGWPFLKMFIEMKTPPLKQAEKFLGMTIYQPTFTLRELCSALITLNAEKFNQETDADPEIWRRLVDVICRQINVDRNEVRYEASYTKDLGVC
ncbi:MAG TPA: phytanoyl-CoA dioxygenase family protein [Planktothrix sp.]|jgi:hypothetical protein